MKGSEGRVQKPSIAWVKSGKNAIVEHKANGLSMYRHALCTGTKKKKKCWLVDNQSVSVGLERGM